MKASGFVCLLVFPALALCQSNLPTLTRASGRVQVKVGGLVLEADEGVQNQATEAIELHGHALVRLPGGSPAWLIRCAPAPAIVTAGPSAIAADDLALKAGMLHARGHIRIKRDFTVWQADEADFYLNAGEAELRGNILVNGSSPEPATTVRRRFGERYSTPEIIR